MRRDKPDLSRLVTVDYSPTEGASLIGLLEDIKRNYGHNFGPGLIDLIDGTCARIRLQLKQLNWPQDRNRAPYPL